MLDKLKDIAIRFQIDPELTVGNAAKVTTVIKILTEIDKSFSNFLEVEFLKNDDKLSLESKELKNKLLKFVNYHLSDNSTSKISDM